MSGWTIFLAGAVTCGGVLIFLRVVALGIDAAEATIRGLEGRERRAQKMREVALDERSPAPADNGRKSEVRTNGHPV